MNKHETSKLLAIITALYPRNFENRASQDIEAIINIWFKCFENIPYDLANEGLLRVIKSKPFAPNPSDVLNEVYGIITDIPDALEEWGKVQELAARYSPYDRGGFGSSRRPLPRLSDITERIVKSMGGISYFAYSENGISDRARFIDAYNAMQENTKHEGVTVEMIEAYNKKMLEGSKQKELKQIGGKEND